MMVHTRSGSTYEVDLTGNRLRKLVAGEGSNTSRAVAEWRDFVRCDIEAGSPMIIVWGEGRDAVSDELGTPECAIPTRMTVTSNVVSVD